MPVVSANMPVVCTQYASSVGPPAHIDPLLVLLQVEQVVHPALVVLPRHPVLNIVVLASINQTLHLQSCEGHMQSCVDHMQSHACGSHAVTCGSHAVM